MCYVVAFTSCYFPGQAIPKETSYGEDLQFTVNSHRGSLNQCISHHLLRTGLSSLSKIQHLFDQVQGYDLIIVPNWRWFTTAVIWKASDAYRP